MSKSSKKVVMLAFDPDWSEETQALLSERLGLTPEQDTRLFENKQKIVLSDKQNELLQAFNEEQDTVQDDTTAEAIDASINGDAPVEAEETETEAPNITDGNAGDAAASTKEDQYQVVDVSVANSRDRDAKDVAKIISDNTCNVIKNSFEHVAETKVMILKTWRSLCADAKASKTTLDAWPLPGSWLAANGKTMFGKKENAIDLGNQPYDVFEYKGPSKRSTKDVKLKGSWYESAFASTSYGQEINSVLETLSKAHDLHVNGLAQSIDMPGEWKGMSIHQLERRINLWESRFKFGVNRLRDAVKFDRQMHAFASIPKHENSPEIGFEEETTKDKKTGQPVKTFVNRNEPITLYRYIKSELRDGELQPARAGAYTVMTFLRFNVAKAILAAGGPENVTIDHITATVKRPSKTPDNAKPEQSWSKHEIDNVGEVQDVVNSVVRWLQPDKAGETASKRRVAIQNELAKNKEFRMSVGDLFGALDGIWKHFDEQYELEALERSKIETAEIEKKRANAN